LEKDSTLKWQKYKVTLGASSTIIIPGKKGLPDLSINAYNFIPLNNDKALSVQVTNNGSKNSSACKLELTVRKINGTAVGRTISVNIPAIGAGETKLIAVDAASILPKNVSLKDTTFKIIVDSAKTVAESDETNNEKWHNLN
jgi:subtilase family serine protease